ncbi:unnamed protein product [Prorocentrum cordatum]|uniref:Pyrrolo-quinoline quinone repeat domain-containing protein n=1 Tax=Prorocentrum cordatum TaxID=2364126 RepID=A0ABN9RZ08_9DINO|nr:unnamed protein product [Polarella glacialis]
MPAAVGLLAVLPLLPAAAVHVWRGAAPPAGAPGGSVGLIQVQGKAGRTQTFVEDSSYWAALNVKNKVGVTRYQDHEFKSSRRTDGKFYWADSSNRMQTNYSGAKDLTAGVSWGWHHPTGVYNTIPVGSPLFDDAENIYIGADDAIRKFSISGVLLWSYAPRGQLAAAPSLCEATTRRVAASVQDEKVNEEQESLLRPDWAKGTESDRSPLKDFQVGDLVQVKPGASYWADGRELYKAGDQGRIYNFVPGEQGKDGRAMVQFDRTGNKTVVELHTMRDHFTRVERASAHTTLPAMLVGSTTSGYVFALDLDSGDELWATWASNEIAGVKGSVGCKGGVVVAATDRCTDRYCYRYRNQTNPLTPGNQYVRGLNAADGSALWEYKTFQPTWNMVPLWGPGTSVMFQDWEGRLYGLDYLTGAERFKAGGDIGTHSNAAAVYSPGHNIIIALGVQHYENGRCNPYPAPGILPSCWTWPGSRGFIRGYNATSGRRVWEAETPEPPASASISALNSPSYHTRLVVTMGHNCYLGSPSKIWGLDPNNGHIRWMKDGPTLWTGFCAGDKEGADIRRAMGGREKCNPNSWSLPVADSTGDLYVGNQVGELMRYGLKTHSSSTRPELLSTLTTGVAFQDSAIAFSASAMAVSTCTSLIVFQTMANFENATWSVSHSEYSPTPGMVHGDELSHEISEESHDDISVTPKVDSDDIWSNDEPVYDPNIDGHTYNRRQARKQEPIFEY